MGNRAVITTAPFGPDNIGVYVHWNGGQESIEGFLGAAEALGFRPPPDDYGWARLAQLIANFFGSDGLSVGVGKCRDLDCHNNDNGVWLIEGWDIVGNLPDPRHPDKVLKVGLNPDPAKTADIKNTCIASVVGDTATLYAQLRRLLPSAAECAAKHGDEDLAEKCTGAQYWFDKVKERVEEFDAFPEENPADPSGT